MMSGEPEVHDLKLLYDEKARNDVLKKLGILNERLEHISVSGWNCVHLLNGIFYFEETTEEDAREFLVAELSDEKIWELDKFQIGIGLKKKFITITDGHIRSSEDRTLFTYQRRNDCLDLSIYPDIATIQRYLDEKPQLGTCDLYLLIPGKLSKGKSIWEILPETENEVFSIFQDNINRCVEAEYNSAFVKNLQRKCLGEIILEVPDASTNKLYRQHAVVGLVMHDTGFCILEILIQNCVVGGNKLLSHYCGNYLNFIYQGERMDISALMNKIHLRKFGKKRSIVFVYGDAEKQEIINALANEEFPMGRIGGDFSWKLEHENIAQYDTAEVYVSQETMLEKCKDFNVIGDERLSYHAIEIFFVELILFQDAAIDKVYVDLRDEGSRQKEGYWDIQMATARYEQISFDMAQAIRFSDYEQFNYPTVRESAKKVAKCFGIDYVFEKYNANKELLESMIRANKRKIQNRQDTIKNQFLLLISALATIGTLGEILYVVYQDRKGGLMCYIVATAVVVAVFGIYKIIEILFNHVIKWLNEKNTAKGERHHE